MKSYKAQQSYTERMRQRGLIKVALWCPPSHKGELSALACKLRMQHNRWQPMPENLVAIGVTQTETNEG